MEFADFDCVTRSFAKASKQEVEKTAARFQVNPQKMELLSILDEQVKLLAKEGRPDLSRFLDSLESHSIAPLEEISGFRAEYGFEKEPVPQGCLDIAINRTVEGIGHLGPSIPLYKKDANGEVTPLSNPLYRWRKKIECESKNDLESPQVYICPLNINANHFTLLEINKQTKMIYHYDSMASNGIIHRKTKSTAIRRVVEEEFDYLGFRYTKAPTPQQRDRWSCGLMVIRNAQRRMMGLPVGTWDDEVDPDRVIKEVIENCQMFLENGAFQPSRLSKKRKVVEGLQSGVPEPSRSSKRLKEMTKD
ncbi:hypothetical protein EG329_004137 [Mollisiaceae sp. DMI_Dod_QoI]|nr:hypothetical protein EG329_004137 [Helotiales sp. DMI_Dod_QoI]